MNQLKVFTIKEANETLSRITPLLEKIRSTRDLILKLEVEIDTLELISEKKKSSVPPAVNEKVEEYNRTVNHFYALIDELHIIGCLMKDVDMGLVDFYSLYKGKIVYLCWKLGEAEISHWHEIGGGYGTRAPIEPQYLKH